MPVSTDKFNMRLVVKNEAGQVDHSAAEKAMGAIKAFGLHSVSQRTPNLKVSESPRELILRY